MEKKQLYQNKKGEYNKFFPLVDLNTVLDSSDDKETTCNVGYLALIPGSGRSVGEGIGYPLQYSWVSL